MDGNLYHFAGLIFAEHVIMPLIRTLYNCAYFIGLILMVSHVKIAEFGPLKFLAIQYYYF